VIALVLSYLVLLWVVASAASRAQGFWAFLAGLLALGAALPAFRRGRRGPVYAVYLGALILATLSLSLEAILRVAPGVLSGHVANVAYTGYHWQQGGIYVLDEHEGPSMRPGVHRSTYWAGRWWEHDANADGYRGPAVDRADAVFLGDSMVYGHGVGPAETLPARFAARTGLAVANLGQQGTCQVQSWLRLERLGLRLRPRVVFASSHFTDVPEAAQWYTPEELERFLASPVGSPYRPLAREEYRPRPFWDPVSFWARHVSLPFRSGGIAGAVGRALRGRAPGLGAGAAAAWTRPSEAEIDAPWGAASPGAPPADALGWSVHVRALREIERLCDGAGARLVLFDLGYPRGFSRAVEALAGELGAEYSPAGRVALEQALAGRPIYLENDGHWTAEGNDVVAAELARALSP
jgi:hypothetical protein